MSFIEYLIDFFKRAGYLFGGLVLVPVGGYITTIGETPGTGIIPTSEPNTFSLIIGIIVIITGIAMVAYAWRSRK